jgi:hypothetical protein
MDIRPYDSVPVMTVPCNFRSGIPIIMIDISLNNGVSQSIPLELFEHTRPSYICHKHIQSVIMVSIWDFSSGLNYSVVRFESMTTFDAIVRGS